MRSLLLLFWIALGISCREPTVKEALKIGLRSGFERTLETPNHLLIIRYIPRTSLLISRAGLDQNAPVSEGLLDSLQKTDSLSEGWMFLLTLSPKKSSPPGSIENDVVYGAHNGFGSYREALEMYRTGWQDKIWIESGKARIPMANYQMENTFGMTPSRNFTLIFPKSSVTASPQIKLVLDALVPGMQREKLEFEIPRERYAISK
jgi:hypothetical protein